MALSAAEVGVFLRALTGRVMGISRNNSVGSVQTRGESKHGGGQADGGDISHPTGNGPAAARGPERHQGAEPPSLTLRLNHIWIQWDTLTRVGGHRKRAEATPRC